MFVNQITVFLANHVGRLADITNILSESKIDIRAMSLAETTDYGILRLIVDKPLLAEAKLRENGISVKITQVIAARLADEPGSLNHVLSVLNKEEISLHYAYAFISPVGNGACVILRPEKCDVAVKVLTENGINLLSPDEISSESDNV